MGPIEYISDEEAEEFDRLNLPRVQAEFIKYKALIAENPQATRHDFMVDWRVRIYYLSRQKAWCGHLSEKNELLHVEHLWLN